MDYIYKVTFKVSSISLNSLVSVLERWECKITKTEKVSFIFDKEISKERLDKVIDIFIEESKKIDLLYEVEKIEEVRVFI